MNHLNTAPVTGSTQAGGGSGGLRGIRPHSDPVLNGALSLGRAFMEGFAEGLGGFAKSILLENPMRPLAPFYRAHEAWDDYQNPNVSGWKVALDVASIFPAVGALRMAGEAVVGVPETVRHVSNVLSTGSPEDIARLAGQLTPAVAAAVVVHEVVPVGAAGVATGETEVAIAELEGEAEVLSVAEDTQAMDSAPGAASGGSGSAGGSSRVLLRTARPLQRKFKHARDFGVEGNYSRQNAAAFSRGIHRHINAPRTRRIAGTYNSDPAVHYVSPETGLNIVSDASGNFVSGWRLNPEQLQNVLSRGSL